MADPIVLELIFQRVGVGKGTPEAVLVLVYHCCGAVAFVLVLEGVGLVRSLSVVAVERNRQKVVATDKRRGINNDVNRFALGPLQHCCQRYQQKNDSFQDPYFHSLQHHQNCKVTKL